MLYCFVNNIHVDYAKLLWEGLYYSLHHPTSSILYPRFTKIIVSHYMTIFLDISRRVRDMYHNLQDDDIMMNIFNSGRHKNKVGMKIPDWMITYEMKQMEHYRMYTKVFKIDVPLTQSQPTESTHGMPRTTSAPRSPNPDKEVIESSAPRRSTMTRLCLPERRSTRFTLPTPVPAVDKADEMMLQDTLQLSLAEHKSREEQEVRENAALVDEHLASEEVEKMDRAQSDKESPEVEIAKEKEVEITQEMEVEITNVIIPVNVTNEDEEVTDEVFELKRREKGKNVEETRNSPIPTPIRSPRIHTNLVSLDTEKLQELTDTPHTTSSSREVHAKKVIRYTCQVMQQVPEQVQNQVPVYVAEGLILERKKAKEETERLIAKAILQEHGNIQAQISTQIENAIANVIPSQADAYMKFERHTVLQTACRTPAVRPRDQDDPHDDAHPEGENSAKRQKTSEYEAYVSGESSSGQVFQEEQAPSTSGNQEQDDDFDFWTDSYATDDDEIPTKQVSQDIMEEVSLTIDEAKLRKMADES
ncbi:hypothetical protein Tco_1018989 [Tanacetum coccineum]|uniref:Uncharacterized protein n=1 Tax=Tanacetum coccineum TaxID=301880 RepID=A0ABQ5FW76_9ASTR